MNLSRKRLLYPAIICLSATLLMPAFFPEIRLFYLSPLLVMMSYRLPLQKYLIYSFVLGTFFGIFSFESRLGLMGLVFVLTSALTHPLKRYVFGDRFYTLPLMTFLLGSLFTLIQGFFFSIFASAEAPFEAVFTEVIIMPLGDALFAFVVFVLPEICMKAFQRTRRMDEPDAGVA